MPYEKSICPLRMRNARMSGGGSRKNSGKGGNTASVAAALAKPIAEELGLSIWDVRFVKEGSLYYLRIFIDKDGGVSIDDCERMSRAVSKPLDDLDPIEQSYILEVCSPGIERELTRPEHFDAMKGSQVRIKLFRPVDGCKELFGRLVGLRDRMIVIADDSGQEFEIAKKDAVSVRLADSEQFDI